MSPAPLDDDLHWYKDAIFYELHVRSFADSTGDGVGDFRGLTEKLDYLTDLGVSALWLLPFYPSPLRDDGYDISDYTGVHPSYGTLADFKLLLREAHRRGLRVITELVLNHTSDQHPWFQQARRAPAGSVRRNFYVWSDTPQRYAGARVIFKDFESSNWSWDPVAGAYFWHRFYSHQPDLNWDNPAVWKAMLRVLDFWLELGVDGLRLDAMPYLYERDGTTCENLPETHAALKALRRHVDKKFQNRMLLAEANQWPEDAAAYFGAGDETHMAFHFPLMPRMFMALRMEDRYPIIDILSQTPPIPEGSQWALFLRNHDELTLEMVTDEERDYMYRVYAHDPQARINLGIRRRLAPLLDNDRRRIELMTGLLLSLPGTPVLYYGDEIGMGDNVFLGDRNAVRTPMQWSADRNAGFSTANPQRLYLPVIIDPDFSYEAVNVQAQHDSPHSLLWWTRRLIALRQRSRAFGRGTLEFLSPSNRKVLAFVRRFEAQAILVVANLSRHAQFVELDLSQLRQSVPVEMLGRTDFPPIGERPYLLTLGPYSFYWFELRPAQAAVEVAAASEVELPQLKASAPWAELFRDGGPDALEAALPRFLATTPWSPRGGRIQSAEILDSVPVSRDGSVVHVALVRAEYAEGDPQVYALPLALATGEQAGHVRANRPRDLVARFAVGGEQGVVYWSGRDGGFARSLIEAIGKRRRFKGTAGEIVAIPAPSYRRLRSGSGGPLVAPPQAVDGDTCLFPAEGLVLKLFRRAEAGPHPDLELGSFLTETQAFPHAAPVAGHLEYRPARGEATTLAVLKGFVPNEGSAWLLSLDGVERYFEHVMARSPASVEALLPCRPLLELSAGDAPALVQELMGGFLETVRLLGRRVGELHLALASHAEDPRYAPEALLPFDQRSLYQSIRNLTHETMDGLRLRLSRLTPRARAEADTVTGAQGEVLKRLRSLLDRRIDALRARVHGDLQLPRLLWTGRDFVVLDFEGETDRPLSARRLKRSPLRDVASLVCSLHGAAYRGLSRHAERGGLSVEAAAGLEPWAHVWALWASSALLRAYLWTTEEAHFLPSKREDRSGLLFLYVLEASLQALSRELEERPESCGLPLAALARLVEAELRS